MGPRITVPESESARRGRPGGAPVAVSRRSPHGPGPLLVFGRQELRGRVKEFSVAATTSPNEPDILHYMAGIYRRQGRWRESLASDQCAQDLDPRNAEVIMRAGLNHLLVRDWPAAAARYSRALEIAPDSAQARIGLAYLEVFRNSNPAAGRKILAGRFLPASTPTGW